MQTGIYAILDLVADMIVGGLQLHKADAAAIRIFDELARDEKTILGKHPQDFALLKLGNLTEGHDVEPDSSTVLTGKQWLALQTPIGERHAQT